MHRYHYLSLLKKEVKKVSFSYHPWLNQHQSGKLKEPATLFWSLSSPFIKRLSWPYSSRKAQFQVIQSFLSTYLATHWTSELNSKHHLNSLIYEVLPLFCIWHMTDYAQHFNPFSLKLFHGLIYVLLQKWNQHKAEFHFSISVMKICIL